MTKLNIRADQVCIGDIFPDGDVVEDFEFFNYPTRKTVEIYVTDANGDSYSKEFDQDAMITVDTDYLDRIFSEWDAEDVQDVADECPRHGGVWGEDMTCQHCTFANGDVRPIDEPGPMPEDVGDLLDR